MQINSEGHRLLTFIMHRFSLPLLAMLLTTGASGVYAQQVALLDTGIDPDSGFNVVGGFNYFLNDSDTSDVSPREGEGHGTVSARLVAESFSGEIVPYVISDGLADGTTEDQTTIARDSALSDILGQDDIKVVGITWGTPGAADSSASLMPSLSDAGKVVAIMAGNKSSSQPSVLATTSFNLSGVIIVGATDLDGELLSFSNKAGTTADKYVAAIGYASESETEGGGTSFATARIAGIAGAVLQQNPNLSAAEVVDVILQSAEDRGETGTDDVYGRGVILSAEQVLNNVIGPVTVPTTPTQNGSESGGGGGGGGAGLLLGGALVGALLLSRKPSDKLEKTLVLDSYGRTFHMDLGGHIAIEDDALELERFFHRLQSTTAHSSIYMPTINTEVGFSAVHDQHDLTDMIAYFALPHDPGIEDGRADYAFAAATKLSENSNLSMSYRVDPNKYFGGLAQVNTVNNAADVSFLSGHEFGSIISGFSRDAVTLGLSYAEQGSTGLNSQLGFVSVNEKGQFGKQSLSSIFQAGYTFADHGGVSVQVGQLHERGSLFGGAANGVFGVKDATTYALNLQGHVQIADGISMIGNYGVGRTRVNAATESLLSDFSTLGSDWFSLGLVARNVWDRSDQIGFSVSQPLKINSGSLNYSIPTQRDYFGNIAFDTERVNLGNADSTEYRYEAYYRTKIRQRLELGAFASFRDNPNHVSTEGDELVMMITLRYIQ